LESALEFVGIVKVRLGPKAGKLPEIYSRFQYAHAGLSSKYFYGVNALRDIS
jgi:hypothetical protein